MKRLHHLLIESAELWEISPRRATWIFWASFIGAVAIAASHVNKDVYRFLLVEAGPVEWGGFVFFVLAILFGVDVALGRFKTGHTWHAQL